MTMAGCLQVVPIISTLSYFFLHSNMISQNLLTSLAACGVIGKSSFKIFSTSVIAAKNLVKAMICFHPFKSKDKTLRELANSLSGQKF